MRVAAVGDVHGRENLAAFAGDLERLETPDLVLLAGDLTDRDDAKAFGEVVDRVRARVACPVYAVFGNNDVFQRDPHWRDHVLFYEYFHGDTGVGVGATG